MIAPPTPAPTAEAWVPAFPFVPAADARNHVGDYATVCGHVVNANYQPSIPGEPTFLDFGRPYPNAVFTVVIWAEQRQFYDVPPETAFVDQDVCVEGPIILYDGKPQIKDASIVTLMRDWS